MLDFELVKETCNGMLPARAYQRIYEIACTIEPGNIVEVGTAHGAATVCLARGLKDSGRPFKVYTFEKIIGGSRERFGGTDENVRIIQDNFARFGVDDVVELIVGDVTDVSHLAPQDTPLAALFLDADGRIDRDFRLFYDRLLPGAPIMVDDVRDETRVKLRGAIGTSAKCRVDQKHRLTHKLLTLFKKNNLIGEGDFIGPDTWAGHKNNASFDALYQEDVLNAYRELVFADAEISLVPGRKRMKKLAERILPKSLVERVRESRAKVRMEENSL